MHYISAKVGVAVTVETQLHGVEPLEAVTLAAVLSWAVYQLCWTLHVCAQTKGL